MPVRTHYPVQRNVRFFTLGVQHDTLLNHYKTTFTLMQDYHWAWSDIQDMIPFERDIYLILLRQWVEEHKKG